ncbi:MAG: response regulator [Rhodobacteraceae bacterium]|nr:MAG: response regulator [Paracoccaceae bacterium]
MTQGLVLLGGIALAFMTAWVVLFAKLLEADRAMDTRVREDAMWAVFQADRHSHTLLHLSDLAIRTQDTALHNDLIRAYDILYSRATLLEGGAFLIDLRGTNELGTLASSTARLVHSLADRIDALAPGSEDYFSALRTLYPTFEHIRERHADLVLKTNHAMNLLRVEERAERQYIVDRLGASGGLLVLAFLGIGAILALQVTHLRRAHRRMAHLQERSHRQAMRARAASQAKSTFLATMSHEIRTPLNGILASTELLGVSDMRPDQARRLMTIRNSGQLLLDVINDVLDFSKLESFGLEFSSEAVSLPGIADLIRSAFETRAEATGIVLDVGLPPFDVETDPKRLRQVIVNLMGNALKFTRAGQVTLSGHLHGPDLLRVEVTDTGIGISEEDQKVIFEEFRQIDGSYARQFGGTGLGLAISRRIVKALGGEIGVESTVGVGSTFWFDLPVRIIGPASAEPAAIGSQARPAGPSSPDLAPLRVLVVEDNPINREILIDLLEHLGHTACIATNGLEAVARVAEGGLDVVLMDMQMPVLSGTDAARQIRAQGNSLPIIAVTANASAEDRKMCAEAGMNDFLSKPIDLDRLVSVLREIRPRDPAPVIAHEPSPAIAPDAMAGHQPVPDGGTVSISQQFRDLAATLGRVKVNGLLQRFEASLPESRRKLLDAIAIPDTTALDIELHTLKGAALTLGLEASGRQAEALRADSASVATVERMLDHMHEELTAARALLALDAADQTLAR